MVNVTTYQTLAISIGDLILDSLAPGNTSGYEVITNVTSALDTATNRYVYTITTATHTIYGDAGTIARSSQNNPTASAVKVWVVGQNATASL